MIEKVKEAIGADLIEQEANNDGRPAAYQEFVAELEELKEPPAN